jgi:membrane protease YdiL (CAAX protease family)
LTDQTPSPPEPGAPTTRRPGAGTFTIEGRAAPGLFVVGWIATILGGGLVLGGVVGRGPIVLLLGLAMLSAGLVAGCGSQAIERRARAEPYAGPSPWLVFAAAVAVTYFFGTILGSVLVALDVRLSTPIAALLVVSLQVAVYFGLVRLLVVSTGALGWREMGFAGRRREAASDAVWGAVLAGPVIAVTTVIALVLVAVLGQIPRPPLAPTGEATGLLLNLLTGAVLAPVGEEILFRGFATTAWARGVSPWRAIARSSFAFAVAHVIAVQGSTLEEALGIALVGFGTRLPIAFVAGYLLLRRGSIWAPIGLHVAFNGVILILGEVAARGPAPP